MAMVEPHIYPDKAPGVAEAIIEQTAEKLKPKKRHWFHFGFPKPKVTKPAKSEQQVTKPEVTKPTAKQQRQQVAKLNQSLNGQHVQFASLAKLEYGLQWGENLIHILAPRLLIVGFVLSMVDLLTHGGLLNSGFMVYTWAIIQAMAIDATLPNMWRLAFLRFDEKRWIAGGVLLIVAIALAGVVLAALSIQFLQQSTGADLNVTMARLGIDANLLSYVRSIAVVALAAILSVLNRTKIVQVKQTKVAQPKEVISDDTKPASSTGTEQEQNTDEIPVLNFPQEKKLRSVRSVNSGFSESSATTKQPISKRDEITRLLTTTSLPANKIAEQVGVNKSYVSQIKAGLNTV